jgi:serine/threonine-protein kinase
LRKALPDLGELRLSALSPELQQLDSTLLDGRYEVGRLLARGGFATVAEGCDRAQENRRCAIKIFRRELGDREWLDRRFHQEVLALEQIHHVNVVHIYGSGILPGGTMYLAMEFIEGVTLREQLAVDRLPIQRIAVYLRQIGSALSAIHGRGICHRDLKPDNLMIRDVAPPGQELVLIDFSIAIVKDADKTVHGLSRAAGTISYMAPEQAIGYADSATDIYSLAKVLVEMLAGERLATALPNASMDLPDRVSELVQRLLPGLSSRSVSLLASALEFDPARRPHDAAQFAGHIADDLEQCDESKASLLQV